MGKEKKNGQRIWTDDSQGRHADGQVHEKKCWWGCEKEENLSIAWNVQPLWETV